MFRVYGLGPKARALNAKLNPDARNPSNPGLKPWSLQPKRYSAGPFRVFKVSRVVLKVGGCAGVLGIAAACDCQSH